MTDPEPRGVLERVHEHYVSPRRARILSRHIASLIPSGARVLDVGCGDGLLSALVTRQRPDITLRGLDVLQRPNTYIPVEAFNGREIPYGKLNFDVVMLIDTLHHTDDPMVLLREAVRVARHAIVIKDHTCDGILAWTTLRFMDAVGNTRHGVPLPHTYWPKQKWLDAFAALGLIIDVWSARLGLYPWPARWVFERSLHFIARLRREELTDR